jgi:hypothetical protein
MLQFSVIEQIDLSTARVTDSTLFTQTGTHKDSHHMMIEQLSGPYRLVPIVTLDLVSIDVPGTSAVPPTHPLLLPTSRVTSRVLIPNNTSLIHHSTYSSQFTFTRLIIHILN